MVRNYLLVVISILCIQVYAQQNAIVDKFINNSGFEGASIGICIKDLSGKEIIGYNKRAALVPASTIKVVTTATALELLGENFRFKTVLTFDKDNPNRLIVKGSGDPTLGSEFMEENPGGFLDEWVKAISVSFKKENSIDIKMDDSCFGYSGVSGKWLQEDMGNYYAAASYGVSVFDNTCRLYFNTMKSDSKPEILKIVPSVKGLVFDNQLNINTTGKDNGYIQGEILSNYRRIVGDIPAKRKSFAIKGDIPDPGLYLGQVLADKLKENGFKIGNVSTVRNKDQVLPENLQEIYVHYSPYLKDIIRVVNEKSNNHYAEHLIRTIGCHSYKNEQSANPLSEGISFVKEYWPEKGLDTQALFMYDGSGLAPSNKISPELLCDILVYMQSKSKYKDSFYNSLPKAGMEGTVKNLLKGTRLEGKVVLKSGSIAEVQCFTGYYLVGDKQYVFTIMVNNYNSLRRQTVKAIENFLLSVL